MELLILIIWVSILNTITDYYRYIIINNKIYNTAIKLELLQEVKHIQNYIKHYTINNTQYFDIIIKQYWI